MRLSTRLLLPLLATVVVVMIGYGIWAQVQREDTLVAESEREIRAYATTLALAVERALPDPGLGDVQDIIDRLTREPTVYGVLVYDTSGAVAYSATAIGRPEPAADSILARVRSGETATVRRALDGEPVLGVLRPLVSSDGRAAGVLEVAQPLAFVAAERARVRQRFLLNTLTLAAALSIMVVALVRQYVSRPLDRFVEATRTLAEGDLGYRLDEGSPGAELAEVAREFNRMAGRLQAARQELVRQTEERLSLERRLRQSEKMAAVGTLAAGLAHEIGAPLHVIRGRADLVLRQDPEPAVRGRNLHIIVEQIDRITLIVRNLLGYARRREVTPVPTDVATVVREVTEFVEGDAERIGADIRVVVADANTVVPADRALLHEVVLNVVINGLQALDSTDGPRRLDVLVASAGPDEPPGVVVEVTDTGPGIPEDVRPRVFDPFFTTKDPQVGSGLGLAVARGIVEDHGGTITIESTPDGQPGARVRVWLPRSGIAGSVVGAHPGDGSESGDG